MYHRNNIIITEEMQMDEGVLGGIGWVLFKYMKKNCNNIAEKDVTTGMSNTFGTLLQSCVRTSIKFRNMGVKKGDIVIYFSGIHLNAGVPIVACFFIGAIPAFIDASLPALEVTHLVKQVTPKLILTDKQHLRKLEGIVNDPQNNTEIVVFGEKFFDNEEKEEYGFTPIYVNNLNEQAALYFSSGSTGLPKGIRSNHYTLLSLDLFEDALWIPGQQKVIHTYDSFYWGVEMLRLVGSAKHGACRLINSEVFDAKKIWHILERYQVNVAHLIPFDVSQMCKFRKPSDVNLKSFTTLYCEGGPLPKQFELELREMLPNTDIFQFYGQTEVGLMMKFSKTDLHKAYSKKKLGCTGMPIIGAGNSYKIVDLESRKPLGPNQEGELCVRSKNIMLGYHNIDSSDRFDEDGWLKTGDLAYYDEDMCFFITGRCKELIIYQGWHITPASFELILAGFPGVVRAVVIGIPHIEDGERPLGLVAVDGGFSSDVGEIERYMAERIPNRPIKVKIVKEIPTTATRKVKRAELREKVLKGEI